MIAVSDAMYANWLPTRLILRGAGSTVDWMDFGETRLDDPFFHQTVARILHRGAHLPSAQCGLDSLLTVGASLSALAPSGFIFHMSRCGSTLVANALRALDDAVVVSEPQPLTELLAPYSTELWAEAPEAWPTRQAALLRATMRIYGAPRRGTERRYFVKLTSWNSLFAGVLRALWPDVPALYLYREPVEVMVSNLRSSPGWLQLKASPDRAAAVFGWSPEEVAGMSREEYCARAIARFCESAARMSPHNTRFVNYQDLDAPMLCRVAEFFGARPTAAEEARISDAAGAYSKEAGAVRPFHPDAARKQQLASPLVREMADTWSRRAVESLTARAWSAPSC